jgi:hypothetical protein
LFAKTLALPPLKRSSSFDTFYWKSIILRLPQYCAVVGELYIFRPTNPLTNDKPYQEVLPRGQTWLLGAEKGVFEGFHDINGGTYRPGRKWINSLNSNERIVCYLPIT